MNDPHEPCWADLWAADPEQARSFYSAVLGWEAGQADPGHGGYFMWFHPAGRPSAHLAQCLMPIA